MGLGDKIKMQLVIQVPSSVNSVDFDVEVGFLFLFAIVWFLIVKDIFHFLCNTPPNFSIYLICNI